MSHVITHQYPRWFRWLNWIYLWERQIKDNLRNCFRHVQDPGHDVLYLASVAPKSYEPEINLNSVLVIWAVRATHVSFSGRCDIKFHFVVGKSPSFSLHWAFYVWRCPTELWGPSDCQALWIKWRYWPIPDHTLFFCRSETSKWSLDWQQSFEVDPGGNNDHSMHLGIGTAVPENPPLDLDKGVVNRLRCIRCITVRGGLLHVGTDTRVFSLRDHRFCELPSHGDQLYHIWIRLLHWNHSMQCRYLELRRLP